MKYILRLAYLEMGSKSLSMIRIFINYNSTLDIFRHSHSFRNKFS